MDVREALLTRRMVRNFTDEPVAREVVHDLVDLARRAPSAGHTQGTELLALVGSAETERFWGATFAEEDRVGFAWPGLLRAPAIVVPWACRQAYLDRYAEPDKGWADRDPARWPVPYWHVDAGFVAMSLLIAVVDAGLAASFFGIFRGVDALRAEFGVPEHFSPVGAIAIGHAAPDRPSRSLSRGRRPLGQVVHDGRW